MTPGKGLRVVRLAIVLALILADPSGIAAGGESPSIKGAGE